MHQKTLTHIKSSALTGAHYDEGRRELTVEFPGGNRYVYHGVSREKVAGMFAADSVGAYFSRHIRSLHAHTKVSQ